jgi:hypothetical protein
VVSGGCISRGSPEQRGFDKKKFTFFRMEIQTPTLLLLPTFRLNILFGSSRTYLEPPIFNKLVYKN